MPGEDLPDVNIQNKLNGKESGITKVNKDIQDTINVKNNEGLQTRV